jgi:hypothetical protein
MAMQGLLTVRNIAEENVLFLNRLITNALTYNPLLA